MIDYSRVYEILSEICEDVSPKRNGNGFVARCPVCGDSQKSKRVKRLHTDFYHEYSDWVCTCYNGGCPFRSGNVYSLYATVKGISFSEAKKYIEENVYDSAKIIQSLSGSRSPVVVKKTTTQAALDLDPHDILFLDSSPDGVIEKRYHGMLVDFSLERRIPEPYVNQIAVAFQGRYKGRVIIPIFINDKMVYFQGRSLFDNIEPKYLNPEVDKELIISNSDKFSRDKYIIVTEGLIDSWMVEDHQGTSVNGGYFSDDLIIKILPMTDKGVILVPDNPTMDKAGREELITYLKEGKYAGKVKYFLMPDKNIKDLNELKCNRPSLNVYDYIVKHSTAKFGTEIHLSMSKW